jgi:predicted secreted hydrolase
MKHVYFAHSLISDTRNRKFYHEIMPVAIVSADSFTKPLFYVDYTSPSLKGYQNYEIEEIKPFKFRVKSRFFDLILTSKKRPLLEGGKGFLDLNGKQTYYYSLTNLETEGWVTVEGKRIKVKGKSWMDHQWADVPYSRDKWSWFSIQLDNDIEMVCYEYDDGKKKTYLASILDEKQKEHHITDVIIVAQGKTWKSPKTGAEYPVSWRIVEPTLGIDLTVSSVMKEQEMFFSTINYWEGPMKVSGRFRGKDAKGVGFMELASYPMNKSFTKMYSDEFSKILNDQLSQTTKKILGMERVKNIRGRIDKNIKKGIKFRKRMNKRYKLRI